MQFINANGFPNDWMGIRNSIINNVTKWHLHKVLVRHRSFMNGVLTLWTRSTWIPVLRASRASLTLFITHSLISLAFLEDTTWSVGAWVSVQVAEGLASWTRHISALVLPAPHFLSYFLYCFSYLIHLLTRLFYPLHRFPYFLIN